MQQPSKKTPVAKCIALAHYAATAFVEFTGPPELASYAQTLVTAKDLLASKQAAYVVGVLGLVAERARVRIADYRADIVVRAVQRDAEQTDGKKAGRLAAALFPGGVTPIVKPVGKTQVDAMRTLEGLIHAQSSWPQAAAQEQKVVDSRVAYETALASREQKRNEAARLRAERDAAREDFLDVFAKVAAGVKGLFPRDKTTQDLFFDEIAAAGDGASGEPDNPEDPSPPAPEPNPAS